MPKRTSHRTKTKTWQPDLKNQRQAIAKHLLELRRRLSWIVASVLAFGIGAYFIQQHIVNWLLAPARHQHFIYTSPSGGIGFLFRVCLDSGIVLSVPVIAYQLLHFLAPVIEPRWRRHIHRWVAIAGLLALAGMSFGYLIGLPLALHFLTHQFTTKRITPLFTISEYMSFVTIYLVGSSLIFQLPLVLIIVNHIRPLPPRRLLGLERWVILLAFSASVLMAPTINLVDQLSIAGPIILAYQVGILLIWRGNRLTRSEGLEKLLAADHLRQSERWERARRCQPWSSEPLIEPSVVRRRPTAAERMRRRPLGAM